MYEGRHKESYRRGKENVPVLVAKIAGEPVLVVRKDVKKYVDDPVFIQALDYYNYTKLWGMPNGRGWANEPADLLDAITALELEAKAIEQEALESHDRNSKTSPKRSR